MKRPEKESVRGSVNLISGGIFSLLLVFLSGAVAVGGVIYVDGDAVGSNDGSSWSDALNYLQDALMLASAGDEIRAAQGVYRPDDFVLSDRPNLGRDETFRLINGVSIRGGYAGFGEPDPDARDVEVYQTILSGDREENDAELADPQDLHEEVTRLDNSLHVVTGSGTEPDAVIEGFVVVGGHGSDVSDWIGGGGMFIEQGSPTIVNCTFAGNYARADGGGIYIDYGSPSISGCTFAGNYSRSDGGGVRVEYGSPTITNCRFINNAAYDDAGALYCSQGGNPVITNNVMIGNIAHDDGGAMYCSKDCEVLISGNVFRGNVAKNGGAIACKKFAKATIVGNTIAGNEALNNAGGIYTRYSTCDIIGNIIKENIAPDDGGGLFFSEISYGGRTAPESNVVGNVIVGNSAGDNGGGIYCRTGSPTFTNNLIVSNFAEDGAGVWCRESTPLISNCTIGGNMATEDGGGILCRWDASPKVINSIVWGNRAVMYDQIALLDDTVITIETSDVEGGWSGDGNIDANPLFAYPGYWDPNDTPGDPGDDFWVVGDYHLQEGSPCIDSGDPNLIADPDATDLDGNPRIVNGIIDMGAYEVQPYDGPIELLDMLANDVIDFVQHEGIANSLLAKIDTAIDRLVDDNENNDAAAINLLHAFINTVEAQRGKRISEEDADELIASAQQIIAILNSA